VARTKSRNSLGGSLLGILVLAALVFLMLNMFGVAQLGKFGCGWEPQFNLGAPAAEAATEGCPTSLKGAATDAKWAADRIATIATEGKTVMLAYDEDGFEHRFTSGEDGDHDSVVSALDEIGYPRNKAGRYPAASHVETKLAYWMREGDVAFVVAVINNNGGPCSRGPQSCRALVQALLPRGSTMLVWWPGQNEPTPLRGGA